MSRKVWVIGRDDGKWLSTEPRLAGDESSWSASIIEARVFLQERSAADAATVCLSKLPNRHFVLREAHVGTVDLDTGKEIKNKKIEPSRFMASSDFATGTQVDIDLASIVAFEIPDPTTARVVLATAYNFDAFDVRIHKYPTENVEDAIERARCRWMAARMEVK